MPSVKCLKTRSLFTRVERNIRVVNVQNHPASDFVVQQCHQATQELRINTID
jgi:hypothetical protein